MQLMLMWLLLQLQLDRRYSVGRSWCGCVRASVGWGTGRFGQCMTSLISRCRTYNYAYWSENHATHCNVFTVARPSLFDRHLGHNRVDRRRVMRDHLQIFVDWLLLHRIYLSYSISCAVRYWKMTFLFGFLQCLMTSRHNRSKMQKLVSLSK
jgi:hypothetical protein